MSIEFDRHLKQFFHILSFSNKISITELSQKLGFSVDDMKRKLKVWKKALPIDFTRNEVKLPDLQTFLSYFEPNYRYGELIEKRWKTLSILGRGGFGSVILVDDLNPLYAETRSAMKQLVLDTHEAKVLFVQEAYIWLSLEKHPNIVYFQYPEWKGDKLYLFLEPILNEDGQSRTLQHWIDQKFQFSKKRILQIMLQILEGLSYAYEKLGRDFVHCDLKPSNLLIEGNLIGPDSDESFLVKISDFGLAKLHDSLYSGHGGTINFRAPEQSRIDGKVNVHADIYALGGIMYQLITHRIYNEDLRLNKVVFSDSLQELLDIALHALAAKETDRHHTTLELKNELIHKYEESFSDYKPKYLKCNTDRYLMSAKDYRMKGLGFHILKTHPEEAERAYRKAIELNSQDHFSWSNLGLLFQNQNRFKEALDAFQKSVSIQPNYTKGLFHLGYLLYELNHNIEAESTFQELLLLNSHYPDGGYYLGLIFLRMEKYVDAEIAFLRAMQDTNDRGDACYHLGLALLHQESFDKALFWFRKSLFYKPNNKEARTKWIDLFEDHFDHNMLLIDQEIQDHSEINLDVIQKALNEININIRMDPMNAEQWYELGHFYFDISEKLGYGAINAFETVIALNPYDYRAWFELATLLYDGEKEEEAEHAFRCAIHAKDDLVAAWLGLGGLLEHQNRLAESREAYVHSNLSEAEIQKFRKDFNLKYNSRKGIDNFTKRIVTFTSKELDEFGHLHGKDRIKWYKKKVRLD